MYIVYSAGPQHMSLKYHTVRPLKFNFLLVVLEMIKIDKVIQV